MFSIDERQWKLIGEWMDKKEKVYTGAIGGRLTYQFTPTNIGLITKVLDPIDKTELDVTNYEEW